MNIRNVSFRNIIIPPDHEKVLFEYITPQDLKRGIERFTKIKNSNLCRRILNGGQRMTQNKRFMFSFSSFEMGSHFTKAERLKVIL